MDDCILPSSLTNMQISTRTTDCVLGGDMTLWAMLQVPDDLKVDLFWAQLPLWVLFDHRGKTLGDALNSIYIKSNIYCMDTGAFLRDVNKLHVVGAIDVEGDRILLRDTLASPLELLARCAG